MEAQGRPKVDLVSLAGITTALPPKFKPRCPSCRYDLSGLPDSKCPECGSPFTLASLIAAWRARDAEATSNVDFIGGLILTIVACYPADLRDPASFVWKLTALGLLWSVVWLWVQRHAEELREEGHRLLWIWGPCASTALALSRTPGVNLGTALLMAALAVTVAWIAWRRSPVMTAAIATGIVTIPVALAVLMSLSLLAGGLGGQARGHHWSFADYPRWYWYATPGRTRGMNNADAVRIGGILLGLCAIAIVMILPMWIGVARAMSRRLVAAARRRTGRISL